MRVYKLHYETKEQGFADLLTKGTYEVVEGSQVYRNGTQSIYYIGQIVEIPETETTPPMYYNGVFFDLMTKEEIDFGTNEVFPLNCVHSFAGWVENLEGTDELINE
tara:strand:- start:320 stop:637 length:318 start_codon:yes stop_codon:yes gene_type:complete